FTHAPPAGSAGLQGSCGPAGVLTETAIDGNAAPSSTADVEVQVVDLPSPAVAHDHPPPVAETTVAGAAVAKVTSAEATGAPVSLETPRVTTALVSGEIAPPSIERVRGLTATSVTSTVRIPPVVVPWTSVTV